MFEKRDFIINLIRKHLKGVLTAEEDASFHQWVSENEQHHQLLEQLTDDELMEDQMREFVRSTISDAWTKVQAAMDNGGQE